MSNQAATGQEDVFSLEETEAQASGRIRHVLHHSSLWYSVIDVIALLTDAKIPRNYWSDLKRHLAEDEGYSTARKNRAVE